MLWFHCLFFGFIVWFSTLLERLVITKALSCHIGSIPLLHRVGSEDLSQHSILHRIVPSKRTILSSFTHACVVSNPFFLLWNIEGDVRQNHWYWQSIQSPFTSIASLFNTMKVNCECGSFCVSGKGGSHMSICHDNLCQFICIQAGPCWWKRGKIISYAPITILHFCWNLSFCDLIIGLCYKLQSNLNPIYPD